MPFGKLAAATFVLAAAALSTMPASAQKFDGRWTVILTTEVGQCEPAITTAFNVNRDEILADESVALKADGAVEASGNMWVRFSAGQDQYRAQGRLTAAGGSGAWSSGSRYCGGKWRASRAR